VARNFGSGGSALDATYGSSSGADTNDPTLLRWTGENYLYLPGVSGNFAETPDSAALDITGDVDVRARMTLANWASNIGGMVITKGNANYQMYMFSSGVLRFVALASPANVVHNATAAVSFAAGATGWIRATLDADNGAGGYDLRFWQSSDGTNWTQVGTTIVGPAPVTLTTNSGALVVGNNASGTEPQLGNMLRAQVRDGINGTVVFDADFTTGITTGAQTTFTESSSNAATVTINRSTSGRKAVAVVRPTWLFGTDDYMEIADNALLDFGASDDFAVVAVVRRWGTTTGTQVAKKTGIANNSAGYAIYNDSNWATRYADGSNEGVTGISLVSGASAVVSSVRTVATDKVTVYQNTTAGTLGNTTDPTTGSLANSEALRIGRLSGAGTQYADMELLAVLLFRRALTAAEIGQLVTYYGT
jgi:hypothetical protein